MWDWVQKESDAEVVQYKQKVSGVVCLVRLGIGPAHQNHQYKKSEATPCQPVSESNTLLSDMLQ